MKDETEAAYAYRMLLVAKGGECEHPVQFRHRIGGNPSEDPNEWECGICELWQLREPPSVKP